MTGRRLTTTGAYTLKWFSALTIYGEEESKRKASSIVGEVCLLVAPKERKKEINEVKTKTETWNEKRDGKQWRRQAVMIALFLCADKWKQK